MNKSKIRVRVLMFDANYPPPIVGGKEKQAYILTQELKKSGAAICAISYKHSSYINQEQESIDTYRATRGWVAPLLFFLKLLQVRHKYDLLHIHTPSRIGHFMATCGYILGLRIVFKFPNQNMLYQLSCLDKILWRLTIRVSSLLVVLEEGTKNILESEWKVEQSKIFLANNGVELHKQKQYQYLKTELSLIFVGRLVEQKRCIDLIYAIHMLKLRNIGCCLKIIGEGPEKAMLQLEVERLDLSPNIIFLGYQSNIQYYLASSDVLVLPSSKEGMSNVLLEAMSIGLPIICTSVGAATRMIGERGEDFLVEPNDVNGIANKIENLSNDPELLKSYGTYLHSRCEKLFSIQSVALTYVNKYNYILG